MDITLTPIDQLKFADYNPRTLSQHEFESLQRSLDEFGFVEPIIVNRRNNVIIGGHQRVRAARELGIAQIPVSWVDLDEQKERTLNIALNAISGEFDNDQLAELIATLDDDMKILTSFTAEEIEHLQDGYVAHEPPESSEKEKTDGKPRYDITLLRQLRDARDEGDNGFVEWLARRESQSS